MDGIEYKIGQLTSEVKGINTRLTKIENKVDNLNVWRWKMVGMILTLGFLSQLALNLLNVF